MQKVQLTKDRYVDYIKAVAEKIGAEKDYITKLDAATGDGDHWVNLNAGFTKLLEIESTLRSGSLSDMFKTAAMTIMSGVGGSSGILYATAYLKAASAVGDAEILDGKCLRRGWGTEHWKAA